MADRQTAAYGLYPVSVALPDVVGTLNRGGFDNSDICMVLSPAHPDADCVRESDILSNASDRAMSARLIKWFSRLGAVLIPTVGCFVRSEAFLTAVTSDSSTSALSRGSKMLLELGFSLADAKRLGYQLYDFGALVYVSCRPGSQASGAIELLRDAGAKEAAGVVPLNKAAAA